MNMLPASAEIPVAVSHMTMDIRSVQAKCSTLLIGVAATVGNTNVAAFSNTAPQSGYLDILPGACFQALGSHNGFETTCVLPLIHKQPLPQQLPLLHIQIDMRNSPCLCIHAAGSPTLALGCPADQDHHPLRPHYTIFGWSDLRSSGGHHLSHGSYLYCKFATLWTCQLSFIQYQPNSKSPNYSS